MSHSFRIRDTRWSQIEKKAWELSKQADKLIKPTDIADAILWKFTKEIELEDVIEAKKNAKS